MKAINMRRLLFKKCFYIITAAKKNDRDGSVNSSFSCMINLYRICYPEDKNLQRIKKITEFVFLHEAICNIYFHSVSKMHILST